MAIENESEARLLEAACLENDINISVVENLLAIERENERRLRRRGIFNSLRSVLEDHVAENSNDPE